ncbi:MAG TPA: LLM class F420-dependent oxidoreductase [Candidatus Binataceae bacterium]|jgi:probable F420-dependent oxidoreductase|nr:LLM class F420-dependent oxidoreductase [Candidatus Binataceae bacterium]
MKYGIFTFPTEYSMRADQLARAVEERGFDSLWFPEHTHIPVARQSPYPAGGELPKDYIHIADPFVGLAAAAAVTKKIKLGTAICLVVEHDPIVLAKQVASIDLLSGGRFIFGIGAGWNAEEMENHGTVFDTRYRLLRERMDAMKAMWTQEEAEYHGKFVNFDPLWSYPKPAQKPWPPIFFGGHTPAARQRVVDLYDGWMPTIMRVQDLLAGVEDLRRRAAEAGRDPKSIDVTVIWVRADRARLDSFEAAGVDRVALGVPSADAGVVEHKLDELVKLARI